MLKRKMKKLLSALGFGKGLGLRKGLNFGAAFHIEKKVRLKPTGRMRRFLRFLQNLIQ